MAVDKILLTAEVVSNQVLLKYGLTYFRFDSRNNQ